MAYKQMFFVQSFDVAGKRLVPLRTLECASPEEAIRRAEGYSQQKCGVIAFSQMVDPQSGDVEEPVLLYQFGRVPIEVLLSA